MYTVSFVRLGVSIRNETGTSELEVLLYVYLVLLHAGLLAHVVLGVVDRFKLHIVFAYCVRILM